jgi:hypothetical protein
MFHTTREINEEEDKEDEVEPERKKSTFTSTYIERDRQTSLAIITSRWYCV